VGGCGNKVCPCSCRSVEVHDIPATTVKCRREGDDVNNLDGCPSSAGSKRSVRLYEHNSCPPLVGTAKTVP
jgi:hypothetical protein